MVIWVLLETLVGQSGVFVNQVVGSGSISGALVSGISGIFEDRFTAPIIDATSGIFDTILVSGTATVTGNMLRLAAMSLLVET